MSYISDQDWADFQGVIEQHAGDDFFTKQIIWKRSVNRLDRYGEDKNDSVDVSMNVLINYNVPRTWPITITTESGAIDKQSVQVFFLHKDFESQYLTSGGYPSIDIEMDRWLIDGLLYKCMGDTTASQIKSKELLYTLILKREETETGSFR